MQACADDTSLINSWRNIRVEFLLRASRLDTDENKAYKVLQSSDEVLSSEIKRVQVLYHVTVLLYYH